MDVFLWIVAGVLAFAFLASGAAKLFGSYDDAKDKMGWPEDVSPGLFRFIGFIEIVAALALIVPPLVDAATVLVPLAATGIVVVMIGAMTLHARRGGEQRMIVVNVILGLLAAFLAVGRFLIEPF